MKKYLKSEIYDNVIRQSQKFIPTLSFTLVEPFLSKPFLQRLIPI
jgi:hypothetical protein